MHSGNKTRYHYFNEILNDLIRAEENIKNLALNYWTKINNIIDLKRLLK
jgi:hypothetical protein